MTSATISELPELDNLPDFVRARSLAPVLGVSPQTLFRWVADGGDFPRPARLSSKVIAWRKADIAKFLTARLSDPPEVTA